MHKLVTPLSLERSTHQTCSVFRGELNVFIAGPEKINGPHTVDVKLSPNIGSPSLVSVIVHQLQTLFAD